MARRGKRGKYLVGGLLLVAGLVTAKIVHRALSRPEITDDIDDNAPLKLKLHRNEGRYPPFYDRDIVGIRVEGELDEEGNKQLIVIGVDQKELDTAISQPYSKFAIACCDGADLWHPAVAEDALIYGKATDQHGDVYAVASYIGPGILMLLPGIITRDGHFTAFKSTRVLALTNDDGLAYDYPNVPTIEIV
jgi:hypothetical protein